MKKSKPRALLGTRISLMSSTHETFRTTLDLFSTGVELMRQNLRREHPLASESEIDRRLREWLHERPGAEAGDCVGRRVEIRTRLE